MATTTALPVSATAADPRIEAFCTPIGPDVFGGIVHGNQIWTTDPFDVQTIHAEARELFARLVNRATTIDEPRTGKTLLLLGEAGSGKTHLMRAFRSSAHADTSAYCGYLQMTTKSDNYARYVLVNLIDSLEQPYKPGSSETGLRRLAIGLLEAVDVVPEEDRLALSRESLEPDDLAKLVHRIAYAAVQYPRFQSIDIDVIRALLFCLANDGRIHSLILKWLRCEDLGKFDRELLGDLVPRPLPEMPIRTIVDLGRLMEAVHAAAFVVLIDQIEEVIDHAKTDGKSGDSFRSAINVLVEIADALPNAVIVLGCLEDLFTNARNGLPKPKLDRLERDPEPIRLTSQRSLDEIESMLGLRLNVLFERIDVPVDATNSIAPYRTTQLKGLDSLRTRDILDNFRRHRNDCFAAKHWVEPHWSASVVPLPSTDWPQRWNDSRSASPTPVLADEAKQAELLAWSVKAVSAEMPNGIHFAADAEGRFVPVEIHHGNAVDKLFVAMCEKNPKGGGLGKQIEELATKSGEIPVVIVRTTAFPTSPTAAVSKQIAGLVMPKGKGRRLVVENSDWKAMAAFREFHRLYHNEPGFADWQRADRPLSELPAVLKILDLDKLIAEGPASLAEPVISQTPTGIPKPIPEPQKPPLSKPIVAAEPAIIRLGQTRSGLPIPVQFEPSDFRRHAAFLGGSGSGKTTAALTAIEQLLLAGVPAVLIDRKGDLSRYADPTAWAEPLADPLRVAARDKLRAAIDVALFTPGASGGRPLTIPVVPADLASLSSADREQLAQFAAAGLGSMMGYKGKGDDAKLVILQKAIEVLARVPDLDVSVKGLHRLVEDQDDALLSEVEGLDAKHFKKLAEDLLTLSLKHRRLLEDGDTLDVDRLLGRGAEAVAGKTRLTIINTQFLGDPNTTDFWVSQFLLSLDRWRAKNPAPDGVLQAVFFLDEADLYLPAVGKPATKGPMESLLKRARSAGIGFFLATQSPGDLDYKCRDQITTWLIGKVKEPVAINKLKPLLEAGRIDAASKLPSQEAGQFFLVRESDVSPIRVDRNLMPTSQLPEDRILSLARDARTPVR